MSLRKVMSSATLALSLGVLVGVYTTDTVHAIDNAAVKIKPVEETSNDRIKTDDPAEVDDSSEVYYTVYKQIKVGNTIGNWVQMASVYINPEDWAGCTLDYTRMAEPGFGNQIRFQVTSNVDSEGTPIRDCPDENRLDPDTVSTSTQTTAWLSAGQSETLTFAYAIQP